MERLDIVVCAKNNEATIGQSLRRILRYALPSQLIIIDGQSSDRTVKIASEMGGQVYSDHGRGLGYARNMAIQLVATPIFGFVDADAFIPSNWLDLLRHMKAPEVAAASATTIYGYGNPALQRLHEWMAVTGGVDVGFVSTIVRKDALLKVGGIREDLPAYEDWELYARLRAHGFKWISDRAVLTNHPESLPGFLLHARRWGCGARICGVGLRRFTRPLLTSPFWGVRLSVMVHPIHAIYYPLLRLFYLRGYVEGKSRLEPEDWDRGR